MDVINWSNYNDEQFTLFCNALFSFEFGKAFVPFAAPGKDGGIDALFNGSYGETNGKWRFQYKFSKQSRGDAARMIKGQIAKETGKLADENNFVLVTNVPLSPQELVEFQTSFDKAAAEKGITCSFFVVDGAKLFNIFLKYPILKLWLEEGFTTAQLQDFKVYFKERLESKILNPAGYNNYFIARREDITALNDFLNEDQYRVVLITGEAGIGKTRLVIEFFHQLAIGSNDWYALVLVNYKLDFDRLRIALAGDKKFIILIDDAHQYSPQTIVDLKTLAGINGNIKLILTSRLLQASEPLALFSAFDRTRVLERQLKELSKADTKELFDFYLKDNFFFKNHTGQLIEISFCKPILIIALISAIENNTPISKIKEHDFLKNYVKGYFDEYYNEVNKVTGIPLLSIKRLLQNIVLIEPVNFDDPKVAAQLAEIHQIQLPFVSEALRLLKKMGFVSGRFEQSIKPDFYSDILLSDIDRDAAEGYIVAFIVYLGHILVNLSSVDEINKREGSLLEELLFAYINQIGISAEINLITGILDTMVTITLVQPKIAHQAFSLYLNELEKSDSPLARDYNESRKYNYLPPATPFNKARQILFNLLYLPAQYPVVFDSFFRLYKLTLDDKLAGQVYQFAKRDITDHFAMERQRYFLKRLDKRWSKFSEMQQVFAVDCLKNLMILDYHDSEPDGVDANRITITTYMLPGSEPVIAFRSEVIDFLKKIYLHTVDDAIAKNTLDLLLDIPRSIFATNRNSRPYAGEGEISLVLDFLEEVASSLGLLQQKEVLDKLYWYKRWKIQESFLPQIDRIFDLLKPKTLAERLTHLFSKTETGILDFKDVEGHVRDRSREIIECNEPHELALAIIELLTSEKQAPHFYYSFQRVIEHEFPEHAKILYEALRESQLDSYFFLGPYLLYSLYYEHSENDYYWKQVALLEVAVAQLI